MGLHDVSEFVEERRALGTGSVETPRGIESLLGRVDGEIDVLGGTLGHFGQELAGRRVEDAKEARE